MIKHQIGKLYFLLFSVFIFSSLNSANLVVNLFDYQGDKIVQVPAGVPFQMHLIVDGKNEVDEVLLPTKINDHYVNFLGAVQNITNINGQISHQTSYKYLMRIDRPGVYDLGQVDLLSKKKMIASRELTIIVVKHNDIKKENTSNQLLELSSAKSTYYVGERFFFSVKFYFKNSQLTNPAISLPVGIEQFFNLKIQNKPTKSEVEVNGVGYHCLEWQIAAVANQAGELVMPAVSVNFNLMDRQQSNFLLFAGYNQMTLFSNSQDLKILNLPKTDQLVQGIGQFTDFKISTDQTEVTAHKPVRIKLELTGQANWSDLNNLNLIGLPAALQAYPGQVVQKEDQKIFEFVVQGLELGDFQIPSQSFYYFDTSLGRYQTLFTKPVDLKVSSVHESGDQNLNDLAVLDQLVEPESVNHEINFDLVWHKYGLGMILFLLILLLVGLGWFLKKTPAHFKLILSLVILNLCLVVWIAILCVKEKKMRYAVVQNHANLYAGPAADYHVMIVLTPSQVVKVINYTAEHDWQMVYLPDVKRKGWLSSKELAFKEEGYQN